MWGDQIKSLQVQVDPNLMRANNVTLDEVMETTSEALDVGMLLYSSGGKARVDGLIDTPNQRLVIHTESPVLTVEQLAEVPIALKTKRLNAPRLGDVGSVVWDTWPMVGDSVINDERGLMMIVEKLPWANTLDVTRGAPRRLGGDADHRIGRDAGVLHGRAGGGVLRAARSRLHPRDAGLHGGRLDGNAGPVPGSAESRRHREARVAARPVAQAAL